MTRAVLVFLAGAMIFAAGLWALSTYRRPLAPSPAAAATHPLRPVVRRAHRRVLIAVQNLSYLFVPYQLTVHVGDTVTWINPTATQHTITSVDPGQFNAVLPAHSSISITFDRLGLYSYYCAFHPYMLGVITVAR